MKINKLNSILHCLNFSVKTTLTFAFLGIYSLQAQSFVVQNRQELSIYGANLVWGGLNMIASLQEPNTSRSFPTMGIDQYHINEARPNITTASDITFYTCAALAAGLSIQENRRIDWRMANVLVQNTLLTANITQTVKVLTARKRPSNWGGNDDFRSFFSGHSSLTASAAATALYYAYHVPNAPKYAKAIGWTSAGLSLLTALLRVEAGKHYPSDVITGLVVGATVAWLNSAWHAPR